MREGEPERHIFTKRNLGRNIGSLLGRNRSTTFEDPAQINLRELVGPRWELVLPGPKRRPRVRPDEKKASERVMLIILLRFSPNVQHEKFLF